MKSCKSGRLSVYVSSPDSYADVFEVFLKGYHKYWADCPYEFILSTNNHTYEGLSCICNHKTQDSWVERTLAAMPMIRSKYILLMCDDLIISGAVDNSKIEQILDYMDEREIKFCRFKPVLRKNIIDGIPFLSKVNRQMPYAINLQIGIFRKDYFESLLGDGSLSAWDIERELINESAKAKDEFFSDVVALNRPVLPFVHGVIKGKWIRRSLSYVHKEYPEYEVKRGVISWPKQIEIDIIDAVQYKISAVRIGCLKEILRRLGFTFVTQ